MRLGFSGFASGAVLFYVAFAFVPGKLAFLCQTFVSGVGVSTPI